MSLFSQKLSKMLFSKIDGSVVISIAGIHATVISILIGLGIACVLHFHTQMNALETDSLKIAENANRIKFSAAWCRLASPVNKFLENWSSDEDQIQMQFSSYWLDPRGKITVKDDMPPLKVYFHDYGLNHTELKLCLMGSLVLRKPFPERMLMENSKFVGLAPAPLPLVFSSMEELEKWKFLVENKLQVIVMSLNFFGSDRFIKGFNWNEKIMLHHKFWKNDPEGYSPEALAQFRELPKEFCSNVEMLYNIAKSLDYNLIRYHYLQKISPSYITIIIILIGAVVTFFSGVIVPILNHKVYKLFIVWIPISFYSLFMTYLFVKVLSIIK